MELFLFCLEPGRHREALVEFGRNDRARNVSPWASPMHSSASHQEALFSGWRREDRTICSPGVRNGAVDGEGEAQMDGQ